MIFDLNRYRTQIGFIKYLLDKSEDKFELGRMNFIAAVTHCPAVVVMHFVGEMYGYTPELEGYIAKLVEYYQIKDVVGRK